MRLLVPALSGFLVCASCVSAPLTPALPIGEFIDQVLDPLAEKLANERVDRFKREFVGTLPGPSLDSRIGATVGAGLGLLGFGFGAPAGSAVGGLLGQLSEGSHQQKLDQLNALAEARRGPLKKELLDLFIKRATAHADKYAVCVEGIERVYGISAGKFQREANGPGPCDVTPVQTVVTPQ